MTTLKRWLQLSLASLGLEVRRIARPQPGAVKPVRGSLHEALGHLVGLGYAPSWVLDVGAANGTPALLDVFDDSRLVCIEPLKENEQALRKLMESRAGKYIIAGAGKVAGSFPFYVGEHPDGSSFVDDGHRGEIRHVPVVRLDDVADELEIRGDVLLKISAQGAELDVLEGARELLASCEIVLIETSLFRFRKGFPDFYDVVAFMKGRSYVVYDIVAGRNRPYDNALAHRYLVFAKEDGPFRGTHQWAREPPRDSVS
jgi:FkbM family methyltransferase